MKKHPTYKFRWVTHHSKPSVHVSSFLTARSTYCALFYLPVGYWTVRSFLTRKLRVVLCDNWGHSSVGPEASGWVLPVRCRRCFICLSLLVGRDALARGLARASVRGGILLLYSPVVFPVLMVVPVHGWACGAVAWVLYRLGSSGVPAGKAVQACGRWVKGCVDAWLLLVSRWLVRLSSFSLAVPLFPFFAHSLHCCRIVWSVVHCSAGRVLTCFLAPA
jgi:hypothetical protein